MTMRSTIVSLLIMLAASTAGSARAQEEPEVDCKDPQTQQDMNYCAAVDFDTADEELNAVYKKARAKTAKYDKEAAELGPDYVGAEAALKKAQRAWVDFRDGHCDGIGFQARGGTLEPLLVAGCKTDLTKTRIKELKELLDGLGN